MKNMLIRKYYERFDGNLYAVKSAYEIKLGESISYKEILKNIAANGVKNEGSHPKGFVVMVK